MDTIKQEIKDDKEGLQPDMFLLYRDGESLYYSVKDDYAYQKEGQISETHITSHRVVVPSKYKNMNENVILSSYPNYAPNLYGDDILVKDGLPSLDWEITEIKEKNIRVLL